MTLAVEVLHRIANEVEQNWRAAYNALSETGRAQHLVQQAEADAWREMRETKLRHRMCPSVGCRTIGGCDEHPAHQTRGGAQ